jgi:hypothetical protein
MVRSNDPMSPISAAMPSLQPPWPPFPAGQSLFAAQPIFAATAVRTIPREFAAQAVQRQKASDDCATWASPGDRALDYCVAGSLQRQARPDCGARRRPAPASDQRRSSEAGPRQDRRRPERGSRLEVARPAGGFVARSAEPDVAAVPPRAHLVHRPKPASLHSLDLRWRAFLSWRRRSRSDVRADHVDALGRRLGRQSHSGIP